MTTPFQRTKESDINPNPEASNSFKNEQLANVSYSNNVSIVKSKEEKVIQGSDNTLITLGRDRPAEIGTGQEHNSAGAIYICAGASFGLPNKTPTNEDGLVLSANRNFNLDASLIYASANCDIDQYFGVAEGDMGSPADSAAIAIKSTNLRLIARNGIKLVTRTDIANEFGAPLDNSISGIEIIAGNDDSDLQPMVKGGSLVDAFNDLIKQINEILDTIDHFLKQQADFNAVLARHTHPDAVAMLFGVLVSGNPTVFVDGKTLVDPETNAQGKKATGFMVENMMTMTQRHRTHLDLFKKQFLSNSGTDYINSRYNKVN